MPRVPPSNPDSPHPSEYPVDPNSPSESNKKPYHPFHGKIVLVTPESYQENYFSGDPKTRIKLDESNNNPVIPTGLKVMAFCNKLLFFWREETIQIAFTTKIHEKGDLVYSPIAQETISRRSKIGRGILAVCLCVFTAGIFPLITLALTAKNKERYGLMTPEEFDKLEIQLKAEIEDSLTELSDKQNKDWIRAKDKVVSILKTNDRLMTPELRTTLIEQLNACRCRLLGMSSQDFSQFTETLEKLVSILPKIKHEKNDLFKLCEQFLRLTTNKTITSPYPMLYINYLIKILKLYESLEHHYPSLIQQLSEAFQKKADLLSVVSFRDLQNFSKTIELLLQDTQNIISNNNEEPISNQGIQSLCTEILQCAKNLNLLPKFASLQDFLEQLKNFPDQNSLLIRDTNETTEEKLKFLNQCITILKEEPSSTNSPTEEPR